MRRRSLEEGEEAISHDEYVVLDSAGRLQIPQEYLDQFGIRDRAIVEISDDGIIVKPAYSSSDEEKEKRGLRGLLRR